MIRVLSSRIARTSSFIARKPSSRTGRIFSLLNRATSSRHDFSACASATCFSFCASARLSAPSFALFVASHELFMHSPSSNRLTRLNSRVPFRRKPFNANVRFDPTRGRSVVLPMWALGQCAAMLMSVERSPCDGAIK